GAGGSVCGKAGSKKGRRAPGPLQPFGRYQPSHLLKPATKTPHDRNVKGGTPLMSKKNKHRDHETEGGVALATDAEEHPSHRDKAKAEAAAYSDGNPLDQIQYLEAKLILKPDRFTSVESFRDFGKLVKRNDRSLKVGVMGGPETGRRPQIREIVFGDTPDYRLYNHAFILRRRISYVDGFPVGDPEIVFKFRHPDEQKAAAVDVRPHVSGKSRNTFNPQWYSWED